MYIKDIVCYLYIDLDKLKAHKEEKQYKKTRNWKRPFSKNQIIETYLKLYYIFQIFINEFSKQIFRKYSVFTLYIYFL